MRATGKFPPLLIQVNFEEEILPVAESVQNREDSSHQIIEGIYVGNSKSGDDVFASNPDKISIVINLFGRKKYEEALLKGNSQVKLMNLSVQDDGNTAEEFLKICSGKESFDRDDVKTWFKAAFDKIDECLKASGKVLIHCHEGISRSVTLTTAYLMKREGWSFDEAMKTVRSARDKASPNIGFVLLLKDYEELLKKKFEEEIKEANSIQYESFVCGSSYKRHRLDNLPL